MDDHFDIGRVFEIGKFDITRLTCSFLSEDLFTFTNSVDPAFHLCLHCLQKQSLRGFPNTKCFQSTSLIYSILYLKRHFVKDISSYK